MSAMLRQRAPPRVLVVGGGPVGLSMAYLLDRVFNVPTRVVERQLQPTTHPQAHFLNLRTMEVLQTTMPGFHDRLLAQAAPSELWRDYIYCTGVGKAREFARIDQFGPCIPRTSTPADALAPISSTQFLHFPQNRFETMLSDFLDDHALPVDRGVELTDLSVDAHGRTNVTLRHNASQELEHATYDFVVGADGAHSLVRERCGIDMVGALNLQSIANIHFTSAALSKAARENPAMLYFIFNKDVIGVLIAHDLQRGEWVFQIPFFPPQESLETDFSPAKCRALVQHILPAGTDTNVEHDTQILSVGQWRMSARVASQYDAHRQRVFLVGDAAHQFPPAGGLGMNTGLQDAHNLAWKLALTFQHRDTLVPDTNVSTSDTNVSTPDANVLDTAMLLRSYEHERQLVAKLNTQLSLRNVARTMKVPAALNVSHTHAQLLATGINAPPLKFLPLAAQRLALQQVMQLGKAPLAWLDDAANVLGTLLRQRVASLVAARASLGMLFYHFDIGFAYATRDWTARAKALMQDTALDTSAQFDATLSGDSTNRTVYAQKYCIGERFPHFWVMPDAAPDTVSTLALSPTVMGLQTRRTGDVLMTLVVDATQLPQLLPAALQSTDSASNSLVQRHVALVVLDASDRDDPDDPVDADTSDFVDAFAAVHRWRVASDNASRTAWHAFSSHHAAALVRPDGHVGCLWSQSQSQQAPSVADALRQSFTLR